MTRSRESEGDELFLEEPAETAPREKKKARKKARRRALARVKLGLAFHLVAVLLTILGMAAGLLGWAMIFVSVIVLAWTGGQELGAAAITGGLFAACAGLLALAGLCDLPCPFLCLTLNNPKTLWLNLLYLLLRFAVFAATPWIFLLPQEAWQYGIGGLLLLSLGAWVCWMLFLRRLVEAVRADVLTYECSDLLVSFFKYLIGSLVCLFFLTIFASFVTLALILPMFFTGMLVMAGVMGLLAMFRIMLIMNSNQLVDTLLAPAGIPWLIRYFNFISGLRGEIRDQM